MVCQQRGIRCDCGERVENRAKVTRFLVTDHWRKCGSVKSYAIHQVCFDASLTAASNTSIEQMATSILLFVVYASHRISVF